MENRRAFLRLAGSLAGASAATGARAEASPLDVPPWTREQGATAPGYGQPGPSERLTRYPRLPPRFPGASSTVTPLQGLHGILTPNGLLSEEASLDAASLPKVAMPNRDGFTADPRTDIPPSNSSFRPGERTETR